MNFVIDVFAQSWSYDGGGVVYPYPVAGHVRGAAKKRVRGGAVPPVYTSHCKGVLFPHELVCVLLPFSGKVAIGEWSRLKALMDSAVGAVDDGEGRVR